MLSFCRCKKKHDALDVSLRISSLFVCNIQAKSPWEFMGCLLPGHICTDHFRFRRQLMWTFLLKSSSFQGCFSESSRQNLSGRSPLNQQCMNPLQTETGGLQVRKKKSFWLVCRTAKMMDIHSGAFVFFFLLELKYLHDKVCISLSV